MSANSPLLIHRKTGFNSDHAPSPALSPGSAHSPDHQIAISRKTMSGLEFLPKEYGYVALVVFLYVVFNFFMISQVDRARIKYNVPYPAMYASDDNPNARVFNCIQRGHQQSLEVMPLFFTLLVLGGMKHPIISAAFGLLFIVTRVFYFIGYSSGVPDKGLGGIGGFWYVAIFGLMGTTAAFGIQLLLS